MNVGIATNNFFSSIKKSFQKECDGIKVSLVKDSVENCDLVVFPGGQDINPKIYGQKNTYSFYTESRDKVETEIFYDSLKHGKKILGICRGHQLINALLGGYLVQDILKELGWSHGGRHDIKILEEDSIIAEVFKENPWVNSLHHQGVTKVGRGLMATSFYGGVVESTENNQIISVQWHPEWMHSIGFFSRVQKWIKEDV